MTSCAWSTPIELPSAALLARAADRGVAGVLDHRDGQSGGQSSDAERDGSVSE